MAKKLKKNAKNIGGTVLPTGIDLDPHNDFTLIEDSKKGQEAYYKGKQIPYLDYFGELDVNFVAVELLKDWFASRYATKIGSFVAFIYE